MTKASVVTDDVIAQKTLLTFLSNYELENIFNADEVGLFYQCLPDTTCPFSGEKCPGGKNRKVQTVGMPARYYQCLWLMNPNSHNVSKTLGNFLPNTEIRKIYMTGVQNKLFAVDCSKTLKFHKINFRNLAIYLKLCGIDFCKLSLERSQNKVIWGKICKR